MQRALAPHGIVVRHRFPGASLGSSRCERPRSGYHGISPWKASARSALVQHERVAFRLALGGCMTSCALRLRKPHRTIGLLAPSVARRCTAERSSPDPAAPPDAT
jgi:hypothetical protein